MIKEFITACRTRSSCEARKAGYVYQSVALMSRARRCSKEWQPHFNACQRFIEKTLKSVKGNEHALLLGVGELNDIPVQSLLKHFKKLTFVDTVFLPQTRRKYETNTKIELLEADITGVIQALIHEGKCLKPKTKLPGIRSETCFISSSCLLSQLPLLPLEYARKHTHLTERELEKWAFEISKAHLDALHQAKATACLISEKRYCYANNKTLAALPNIRLPSSDETWTWDLAPRHEVGTSNAFHAEVHAFELGA